MRRSNRFMVLTGMMLAGLLAGFSTAGCWPAHSESPASQLRDEIQCLNLINGLYLSADQIRKLLPLLERGTHAHDVLKQRAAEVEKTFMSPAGALRTALASGRMIDETLARPIHQTEQSGRELIENHELFEKDLASQLAAVLDDNQKQRVIDYKACLVPTPDLRNPDRIGSSEATTEGPVKILDRARKAPERKYQQRKSEMLDRLLEKVKKHYAGLDLEAFRAKVEDVVSRARAMNDLEYETNREALVRELKPPDENLRNRDKDTVEGKLGRFFLRPCVTGLLSERLHLLAEHQPPSQPVDLTHVQALTNCKDGHCALNR